MGLNKSTGNMYSFVTHTWNTVKGKCPHDCSYCYMKRFGEQKPIRFDDAELKTDLGEGNFIFVGSSCDMWAKAVPDQWIDETLNKCLQHKNRYLFQSKNPIRFHRYGGFFPIADAVFGTTIESNWDTVEAHSRSILDTPSIESRILGIKSIRNYGFDVMITIEPIMRFHLRTLAEIIDDIHPKWVNIGADSGGHNLPEPPAEKILELIHELKKFTEVKIKKTLLRICRDAK